MMSVGLCICYVLLILLIITKSIIRFQCWLKNIVLLALEGETICLECDMERLGASMNEIKVNNNHL